MPQRQVEKDGQKKLIINVSVRCKEHPSGRIQVTRIFDDVEPCSTKANSLNGTFSAKWKRNGREGKA